MKRDESLKTLSWEHHDGLVVAFRLQQGLKKGTDVKDLADYILYIWQNVLEHHFWQEEQVFPGSHQIEEVVARMFQEHRLFRDYILRFEQEKYTEAEVKEFAALLNRHIRFEERELFPLLESNSTREKLAQIGDFLRRNHRHACTDWQPKFWQNEQMKLSSTDT